jgi:tRNA(fMet)-specific endonuclease VapC
LKSTLQLFADVNILDYSFEADELFQNFRRAGIRIGTQDLRIASVILVHQGILLTRNLRDFEKVPGIIIEDWSIPVRRQ